MSEEIEDLIEQAKQHGFFLRKTPQADAPGAPRCWLGGAPTLPAEIAWPYTREAYKQPSIPLHFIAQIDLAAIPWHDGLPDMPHQGALFFFFDPIFGPTDEYRHANAQIIYVSEDVSGLPERVMPALPNVATLLDISDAYEVGSNPVFKRWNFTFESKIAYDTFRFGDKPFAAEIWQRHDNEQMRIAELSEADWLSWDKDVHQSVHAMFAGPTFINDYDRDDTARRLHNRVPLLAISDDEDLGVFVSILTWGVVFWVEADRLSAGDFSSVFAMPN